MLKHANRIYTLYPLVLLPLVIEMGRSKLELRPKVSQSGFKQTSIAQPRVIVLKDPLNAKDSAAPIQTVQSTEPSSFFLHSVKW